MTVTICSSLFSPFFTGSFSPLLLVLLLLLPHHHFPPPPPPFVFTSLCLCLSLSLFSSHSPLSLHLLLPVMSLLVSNRPGEISAGFRSLERSKSTGHKRKSERKLLFSSTDWTFADCSIDFDSSLSLVSCISLFLFLFLFGALFSFHVRRRNAHG